VIGLQVRYLGNVLTAFVKGDGCVDRPTLVLWNNYNSTSSGGRLIQVELGRSLELKCCINSNVEYFS